MRSLQPGEPSPAVSVVVTSGLTTLTAVPPLSNRWAMREASSSHSGVINTTCVFAPISARILDSWVSTGTAPSGPSGPITSRHPTAVRSVPSDGSGQSCSALTIGRACRFRRIQPEGRIRRQPTVEPAGVIRTVPGRKHANVPSEPGEADLVIRVEQRVAADSAGGVDSERDRVGFGRVRGSIRRGSCIHAHHYLCEPFGAERHRGEFARPRVSSPVDPVRGVPAPVLLDGVELDPLAPVVSDQRARMVTGLGA